MFAHFRPNEFLNLRFDANELLIGYNVLKALYVKTPTGDLAKMIQAMEEKLFPKPKLTLVTNYHWCSNCHRELDVRVDRYQLNTNSNGILTWRHQSCVKSVPLEEPPGVY